MIDSIVVKNFKSLKDFEIKKLGSVNLIVGKNNSGKSTVLESIRILAAKGNPQIINGIIKDHDDQVLVAQSRMQNGEEDSVQIYEGIFSDRKFPKDGAPIYIGNKNKNNFVEIKRVYYEESLVEKNDDKGSVSVSRVRKIYDINDLPKVHDFDQVIQVVTNNTKERPFFLNYNESPYIRNRMFNFPDNIRPIPISYIPTQFLSMELLANLWDKTVLTDYFNNVRNFLKVISDDLEDVAFIKVNNKSSRTGIVKLKGLDKPIPLNSMGDGVLRILQLVLGILPASQGILLIDEFENGLHYSVQKKVWELIFRLAEELNIQVFATTHSWDCIEAFTCSAKDSTLDSILCRIGNSISKDDYGKTISTIIEKDSLSELTQSEVELR